MKEITLESMAIQVLSKSTIEGIEGIEVAEVRYVNLDKGNVISDRVYGKYYESEKSLVLALMNPDDSEHEQRWDEVEGYISVVVRKALPGLSHEDAEDLLSVCFERIAKGISTYDYRSSFRTWIMGIAMNTMRIYRRQMLAQKRDLDEVQSLNLLSKESLQQPIPGQSPGENAMYEEVLDLIDKILSRESDPRLRMVLLMSLGEFRGKEIAQALGMTQARVSTLLRTARELLRTDSQMQAWADKMLLWEENTRGLEQIDQEDEGDHKP